MIDTAFTISYGDKPEALDAVLDIMRDCGAVLEVEVIQSGEDLYRREIKEGILPEVFDSLKRTRLFLKAPTKKPRGDDYMEVMDVIREKLDVHTKLEYFVSDTTPGIGIVAETEETKITPQTVEDLNKAALRLGGLEYAYNIDELRVMFETSLREYPQFKVKFGTNEELKEHFADFDVIFTNQESARDIKKAIKPKIGCNIYLGHDYALFEPMEDYNKHDKGLLLAAALMIKYSGQQEAAWAIYEKLSSEE